MYQILGNYRVPGRCHYQYYLKKGGASTLDTSLKVGINIKDHLMVKEEKPKA